MKKPRIAATHLKARKAMYDALRSAAFIGSHHGFDDYADLINDIADKISAESQADAKAEIERRCRVVMKG